MREAIVKNSAKWLEETKKNNPNVEELDFVIGLTYGTPKSTNNKEKQLIVKLLKSGFREEDREKFPGVVIDNTNKIRVYTKIGVDYWAFIGNPTEQGNFRFVFLEVLLALVKATERSKDKIGFEAEINRKLDQLSKAFSVLKFPNKGIPQWIKDSYSQEEFFRLATCLPAFFD